MEKQYENIPDSLIILNNICIDRDIWERLEEYWRKEDEDSGREIDSNIQEAIKEYLDKRKGLIKKNKQKRRVV